MHMINLLYKKMKCVIDKIDRMELPDKSSLMHCTFPDCGQLAQFLNHEIFCAVYR